MCVFVFFNISYVVYFLNVTCLLIYSFYFSFPSSLRSSLLRTPQVDSANPDEAEGIDRIVFLQ